MPNPINLQKPLQLNGESVYPLTSAKQVLMPDGTRLDTFITNYEEVTSPTIEVSKSGTVTTISITDKTGTKTATINDGQNGYTPIKNVDYFDGYTPVVGVDYFTQTEKDILIEEILLQIDDLLKDDESNNTGDNIDGEHTHNSTQIVHGTTEMLLSSLIDMYVLNIDYENTLAFNTSEVIFDTSPILGQAVLDKMILA